MLAIVIPYYKLSFFRETLESLAIQTCKEFKVYIGNDGSPESPDKLIDEFKDRISLVYHRFDDNLGSISLVQQWDRCIALTQKEQWIMILGDDDVLGANCVEKFYFHLNSIDSEKINVVKFASQIINEKGNQVSKIYMHDKHSVATNFYMRRLSGEERSSLSEHVFKKNIYDKFRFKDFPLAWHSDDCAWIEFSINNLIFCINEAIVYVRMSNLNISGMNTLNIEKNVAAELFYKYIVSNLLDKFKKSHRLIILYQYEVAIKNNRRLVKSDWSMINCFYLRNLKILNYIKFIRRYLLK